MEARNNRKLYQSGETMYLEIEKTGRFSCYLHIRLEHQTIKIPFGDNDYETKSMVQQLRDAADELKDIIDED